MLTDHIFTLLGQGSDNNLTGNWVALPIRKYLYLRRIYGWKACVLCCVSVMASQADSNFLNVKLLWDIENVGVPKSLDLEKCVQILTKGVMKENGFTQGTGQRIRIVCGGKRVGGIVCGPNSCHFDFLVSKELLPRSGSSRIFPAQFPGVEILCGWTLSSLRKNEADQIIMDHLTKLFRENSAVRIILVTTDEALKKKARALEPPYLNNKIIIHPKDVWDLSML